jgi:hypothetical protein
MIEWFFLNGIDAISAGTTIGGEHNPTTAVLAHIAKPLLTLTHFAVSWTKITLHTTVFQRMPVFCLYDRFESWFVHIAA